MVRINKVSIVIAGFLGVVALTVLAKVNPAVLNHKQLQKHHQQYSQNKIHYLNSHAKLKTIVGHSIRSGYTLFHAFQDALYYDAIYAQARSEYDAVKENKLAAWSAYLPQLSTTGEVLANTELTTTNAFTVNAQQLIFNWSAIKRIAKANAQVRQAVYTLSYAEQQLMERTAKAYLEVVKLQSLLQVNQSQLYSMSRQLSAVRERLQHGHATVTDVNRVKGLLDLYRSQVTGIRIYLQQAKNTLTEITGRVIKKLPGLAARFKLLKPKPISILVWQKKVKHSNLSLQAAEEGVLVAKAEVGVATGGYLPSVSFAGTYYPEKVVGIDKHFTYGLNLSFSPFDGGDTIAAVNVAKSEYQTALSKRDMAFRDANRKLNSAYAGMLLGVSQIRSARQSVYSNQRALAQIKEGYIAGTQTILDVIDQQSKLFEARRAYVNDRVNYISSMITLELSSGSLSPQVLKHLGRWFG